MDRYRSNIARSAAAAAVAVFLVAGGAFAANAVFAPASSGATPAATFATDDLNLTVAATAEPAETAEPNETAEPAETAEPNETADVQNQQGDDKTAEPAETAEPNETAGARPRPPSPPRPRSRTRLRSPRRLSSRPASPVTTTVAIAAAATTDRPRTQSTRRAMTTEMTAMRSANLRAAYRLHGSIARRATPRQEADRSTPRATRNGPTRTSGTTRRHVVSSRPFLPETPTPSACSSNGSRGQSSGAATGSSAISTRPRTLPRRPS